MIELLSTIQAMKKKNKVKTIELFEGKKSLLLNFRI